MCDKAQNMDKPVAFKESDPFSHIPKYQFNGGSDAINFSKVEQQDYKMSFFLGKATPTLLFKAIHAKETIVAIELTN